MNAPKPHKGMLPGMAAIAIFLLVVSMFSGFKMLHPDAGPPAMRYATLAVSTLVLIGVFGFLKLRRWGWALVSGGCILGAFVNFWAFHQTRVGGYLVQGMFSMLFFMYLVRPEVRERVH